MIKREKYLSKINQVLSLNKSVFLVGARQVGKTSLMKFMNNKGEDGKKSFYINFDEIVTKGFIEFLNLQEFIDYLNAYYSVDIEDFDILFFDEVVRIRNFNIILKGLIDKFSDGKKAKRFISSASGNYEVVNDIVEGLAGRVVKIEVFPLDFKEFLLFKGKKINLEKFFLGNSGEKFYDLIEKDLLEFLTFGSYPEVVLEKNYDNKSVLLKSIIDSVFERDLRGFIKEEKFIDLEKLINYLSRNIGSLFSYEGVSRDLGIKLNDVKNFIFYLEKSHLIFKLNPFFTDKKSEYSSKQKIYFNNFGTINYFSGNLNLKKIIDGKDVEQTLFLNLKFNLDLNDKLYFYQKMNGSEIDFILNRGGKIFPIEAKLNNKDIVPKVFFSFYEKYSSDIGNFSKTTKNISFERDLGEKKVLGKPFFSIF